MSAGENPKQSAGRGDQDEAPDQPAATGDDGRSRIQAVASSIADGIADGAGSVVSAARAPIGSIATGARRLIDERPGADVRRVRRKAQGPLLNLWDAHPEARRASIRQLGLIGVPVDEIRGTAVEGAAQRGGDFLPLKDRRSDDWRSRWQRILGAIDRLDTLPPVELIKFGGGYWVVDGHNRVAAALYNGQVEIDAVVEELRLPGMRSEPAVKIATVLDGSLDLRAAGSGRLSRTVQRPSDLSAVIAETSPHDHVAEGPPGSNLPDADDDEAPRGE